MVKLTNPKLIKAHKLPKDLPGCGWYEILPQPAPPRQLDQHIKADWVIVGAGFTGLSAARRLTQLRPNDKVVVLDAQPVGWGAAGRNSGFMIDIPHELQSDDYAGGLEKDKEHIRLNRTAVGFAQDLVKEYGLGEYFSMSGKIHGTVDDVGMASLKTFEGHLNKLGEVYTSLSSSDMKRITGTDYYTGGMHAHSGAQIQPAGYIRGLAEGLKDKIYIFENSPVISIDQGTEKTVSTPNGSVTAPKIIMAVNGKLEWFGFFKRRLMHVYTFASMTRQLTEDEQTSLGGDADWGLVSAHPMGTSIRKLQEGRIIVRSVFTYNPTGETSAAQVAKLGRVQDKAFAARFPMLDRATMEHRWGGHLCLSLNSAPAFGELEQGLYSACCQQGLGVMQGTLAGKLIAELATGQDNDDLATFQSFGTPKKLYPRPFMALGAKTHLWWSHLRAGKNL
jgi:glycine/D-amino acid oxidase-like deaminating enzyme